MPQSRTLSVGLAVHNDALATASVAPDPGAAGGSRGPSGPRQWDLAQCRRRLPSKRSPLVLVYDAGPCGSWRARSLTTTGQGCWIVAPSLLPKKPGARVKTHRRAASQLARLLRSGDLPPVSVPQVEAAAMRDLGRARADALHDLQAAQGQLTAFFLRPAMRYTGRATWSPAPLRWLSAVVWPPPAQQSVFPESVRAVTEQPARLARLAPERKEPGQTWRLGPVGAALQALRGVQCTVAVSPGAALGDLPRCETPRQLMHSLGVPPSAYSTGERRRQGGIPKAGTTHARRALSEGAWAYR